jgi:8-oxo-dGTP pyrophosphatase MutT (NUDIX family)
LNLRLKDRIRSMLAELPHRREEEGFTWEAAVLMPIFEIGGEPHFLLTRRTDEVQTHKGQISFPGGMREGDEELQETALRETFEEVGIEPEKIEVLGSFHDFVSITGYRVTPFAGYLEGPFTPIPQASEVAEVLTVPFEIFTDPVRLRVEQMFRFGKTMDVYYYSYLNHQIWGLTARMIKEFLENLACMG